jgi:V/A-type H+-transporting ATPase subunit E
MEFQLNDLIGKIQKEGVEAAQKQADDIIAKAKVHAEKILEEAYQRSHKMRQEAEREIARTEEASRSTLRQAARDLILSLEKELTSLLDVVLKEKAETAMTPQAMVGFINLVLPSFLNEHGGGSLLIPQEEIASLEASLRSSLSDKIKADKIELKPFKSIEKGFKLKEENGIVSYDFTLSAICEVLADYINPRFSFLLKESEVSSK